MKIKERNPKINNVYPEIGSSFGTLAIDNPEMCQHLIGRNIKLYGADHVIWGTDCLWWGSPQWAIDAFKRFQISDELCEKFGYKKLTKEDKAKIFGLNAAKIYGVDADEKRKNMPKDELSKLKTAYLDMGGTARERRLRLGSRRRRTLSNRSLTRRKSSDCKLLRRVCRFATADRNRRQERASDRCQCVLDCMRASALASWRSAVAVPAGAIGAVGLVAGRSAQRSIAARPPAKQDARSGRLGQRSRRPGRARSTWKAASACSAIATQVGDTWATQQAQPHDSRAPRPSEPAMEALAADPATQAVGRRGATAPGRHARRSGSSSARRPTARSTCSRSWPRSAAARRARLEPTRQSALGRRRRSPRAAPAATPRPSIPRRTPLPRCRSIASPATATRRPSTPTIPS